MCSQRLFSPRKREAMRCLGRTLAVLGLATQPLPLQRSAPARVARIALCDATGGEGDIARAAGEAAVYTAQSPPPPAATASSSAKPERARDYAVVLDSKPLGLVLSTNAGANMLRAYGGEPYALERLPPFVH